MSGRLSTSRDASCRSSIEDIEQLLVDENYSGAEVRLQSLPAATLSGDLEFRRRIAAIKVEFSHSHYDIMAIIEAEHLAGDDPVRLAIARQLYAAALFLSGNHSDCLKRLAEVRLLLADVTSTSADVDRVRASTENMTACILMDSAEAPAAIPLLESAKARFERIGESKKAFGASMNLAGLLDRYGRLRDAHALFLELKTFADDPRYRRAVLYNLKRARVETMLGNTDKARDLLRATEEYLSCDREQALYWQNLGLVCLAERKYRKAASALSISLRHASQHQTTRMTSLRLLADARLHLDEVETADDLAKDALRIAHKSKGLLDVGACLRTLGGIAAACGRFDISRRRYIAAFDLLEWGEAPYESFAYEYAVTCHQAAHSGAFTSLNEIRALLAISGEYFARERLTPPPPRSGVRCARTMPRLRAAYCKLVSSAMVDDEDDCADPERPAARSHQTCPNDEITD